VNDCGNAQVPVYYKSCVDRLSLDTMFVVCAANSTTLSPNKHQASYQINNYIYI